MKPDTARIPEDRPLRDEELNLITWLLNHGESSASDFLPQLADARIIGRCACGCASIDLAISNQRVPASEPLDILADYCWHDSAGNFFGVFVFARGGLLAGLELWSIDGQATAYSLPHPSELKPLDSNQAG